MATVAVSAPAAVSAARDRVFYSGMAIVMALTVFVGFAPTFYLRGHFGAPRTVSGAATLTPLVYLHGFVYSAWVLLFVAQTALVAARRVALHRRMGIAGGVLAVCMVVLGVLTAIYAAARGSAPPGIDPLAFMAIPLGDMVLFSLFVGLALRRRRDKESHKRLMVLAYTSIIVAAVARIPGLIALGPPGFFSLSLVFVVAGMMYDLRFRGRVHRVYWWGGALLAASVPIRLLISGTTAWHAFAALLTGR